MQGMIRPADESQSEKVGWGSQEECWGRGVCPSMEVDFRVDGGLGRIWESPPSDNDPL